MHRFLLISALASSAALAIACRPDAQHDEFARTFIRHLVARDSAGFAQLEPQSEVSRRGWAPIAAMADALPADSLQSIHLIELERGLDSQGAHVRLVYELRSATERAQVELWLVDHEGHTYVNTVRIHPRVPSERADISMRLYN